MANIAEIGTFLGSAAENYAILQQQDRERQRLAAEFAELQRRNRVSEQMAKIGLNLDRSELRRKWAQDDWKKEMFERTNQAELDKEADINEFVGQLSGRGSQPSMTKQEFATGSAIRGVPQDKYKRLDEAFFPEAKKPEKHVEDWRQTGRGNYYDISIPEQREKFLKEQADYNKEQSMKAEREEIDKWIDAKTKSYMENVYDPKYEEDTAPAYKDLAKDEKYQLAQSRAITEARQKFGNTGSYGGQQDFEIPKNLAAPPVSGDGQIVKTTESTESTESTGDQEVKTYQDLLDLGLSPERAKQAAKDYGIAIPGEKDVSYTPKKDYGFKEVIRRGSMVDFQDKNGVYINKIQWSEEPSSYVLAKDIRSEVIAIRPKDDLKLRALIQRYGEDSPIVLGYLVDTYLKR